MTIRKVFCCEFMDNSVRKGIIKYCNLTENGDKDFDTYYLECVKERTTKRHLWIWNTLVVNTEDVIIHHCPFCGVEL